MEILEMNGICCFVFRRYWQVCNGSFRRSGAGRIGEYQADAWRLSRGLGSWTRNRQFRWGLVYGVKLEGVIKFQGRRHVSPIISMRWRQLSTASCEQDIVGLFRGIGVLVAVRVVESRRNQSHAITRTRGPGDPTFAPLCLGVLAGQGSERVESFAATDR